MIEVRRSRERGSTNLGWLYSRHTFSFGEYHDPRHMGFRSLRVINEDRVVPGAGFGTHGHHDMEILSYVLDGALEHKDSMGNGSVIRPGDIQVMSAGTGVVHSERNHSPSQPVHFLQIWIEPDARGVAPRYEQKRFSEEQKQNTVRLIASRDGREGSVTFQQDASLYTGLLDPGGAITMPIAPGRRAWVQVVRGEATVNGETLAAGDGAAIESEATLELRGRTEPSEVLVFDLG